MAVPTLITDLSTTAASNAPAGSDSVFPDLDNFLRAYGAFIAQLNATDALKAPIASPTFTGNAGFGVTPQTWYSSYGTIAIQFAASGALAGLDVSSSDRRIYLFNNAYLNSSGLPTYINTGAATQYVQTAGVHKFSVASSGASGASITWSDVCTIDSVDGPQRTTDATTANGLVRKSQMDAAIAGAFAAGDTKYSYQTADHGRWLMVTGPQRTIGNAGSGATARANADTLALYTLLWSLDAADIAIYTSTGAGSTRGASAAADFAALKRIDLPNESGLVSKGHHGGNGALTTNTTRRLGSVEMDDNKSHTHTYMGATGAAAQPISASIVGGKLTTQPPDETGPSGGPETLVRNRSKNAFIYF